MLSRFGWGETAGKESMTREPRLERSPGMKLLFAALVAAALAIPLLMVYALIWDRQSQSETAQASITQGWGGPQVIAGPIVVVPFRTTQSQAEEVGGRAVTRTVEVEKLLYISPVDNRVRTRVTPQERRKSIYRSVLYEADVAGTARFELPADLPRFGVTAESVIWDRAELRVGASDARGLTRGGRLRVAGRLGEAPGTGGEPAGAAERDLVVQPGRGPAASGGQGFFAFVPWNGLGPLEVSYSFRLRGSRSLTLVPRGGRTSWQVASPWHSPSFAGDFLPESRAVSGDGFTASYLIDKLALGQPPVATEDFGPPFVDADGPGMPMRAATTAAAPAEAIGGPARAITVGLIEPVNLYSRVDRAVKYGFLFIGFTFLAFLMFDVVGGARVAAAEYLLTGAGLVLFFVLLLALAEVIGFTAAYVLASAAIIGLLTAYSAAVLDSWRRARFIGALLVGLYALLFVLLNLEAWSLLIGALLLFVALAAVMYATRRVDWGSVGRVERITATGAGGEAPGPTG